MPTRTFSPTALLFPGPAPHPRASRSSNSSSSSPSSPSSSASSSPRSARPGEEARDTLRRNARSVAQAVAIYGASEKGYFPPHYVYVDAADSDAVGSSTSKPDAQRQSDLPPLVQYSLLADGDRIPHQASTCPTCAKRRAPRPTQVPTPRTGNPDKPPATAPAASAGSPGNAQDKQAKRIAYTGNAAVFPRASSPALRRQPPQHLRLRRRDELPQ